MTSVPSLQRIARATSKETEGDRVTITLENGLKLDLAHHEDLIGIYRAVPAGSPPEMWTDHMDRPGLYIHVGDWPATLDADDALDRALEAQGQAEIDFDLNNWAPPKISRAVAPSAVA